MPRKRVEDPEARAKIAAAAEELFAERGFDGAAIRDIARKAGVNGAMIHYYFGNKEGLYHAMLEGAASRIGSLLIETIGKSGYTKDIHASLFEDYDVCMLIQPNISCIPYCHRLTDA